MNKNDNEKNKNKDACCNQAALQPPQKAAVNIKNAPSSEDWEGGASRPEEEGQLTERRKVSREGNFQSIPTQNTHEIDADQEVDESSK